MNLLRQALLAGSTPRAATGSTAAGTAPQPATSAPGTPQGLATPTGHPAPATPLVAPSPVASSASAEACVGPSQLMTPALSDEQFENFRRQTRANFEERKPGAADQDAAIAAFVPLAEVDTLKEDDEILPDDITKQILNHGDGDKQPKAGDKVTVHCAATLESDGSEYDSRHIDFYLGQDPEVHKGIDLAVKTMRQGEIAKFTLPPKYAYNRAIGPFEDLQNVTLVAEIELLSWVSNDLFEDEGVIKTEVKKGNGLKKPKNGDEVLISMKCVAKDGTLCEEKNDFEYEIGSEACGLLSQVVDKALGGMLQEEEVELACTSQYALREKTPDGATISLKLNQIYETKDVSAAKDKTLLKKTIVEGEEYDTPEANSKVQLSVQEKTAGSLPGFTAKTLEFTVGKGEVCDALELAVGDMLKGEKAVLTCTTPEICCEEQLGLADIAADAVVVLTLELVEVEQSEKQKYRINKDVALEKDFDTGEVIRIVKKEEIVSVLEGPKKQKVDNAIRARGTVQPEGKSGWFTVKDALGVVNAEASDKFYFCKTTGTLTTGRDPTSGIIQRVAKDEVVKLMGAPCEIAGMVRHKVKTVKDKEEGWMTTTNNKGRKLAEQTSDFYVVTKDVDLEKKKISDAANETVWSMKEGSFIKVWSMTEVESAPITKVKVKTENDEGWIRIPKAQQILKAVGRDKNTNMLGQPGPNGENPSTGYWSLESKGLDRGQWWKWRNYCTEDDCNRTKKRKAP